MAERPEQPGRIEESPSPAPLNAPPVAALGAAPGASRSLSRRARGLDRFLGLLIMVSGGLLVLGWTLPIMTVETLFFLTEPISILDGCRTLWVEGEYFLFAIIALFSIVFPLLKLGLALNLWLRGDATGARLKRHLGWVEQAGRWSMLDVFVVALTVVAIEVSLISDVALHAGLYVFSAAILLSMIVVRRITALARRAAA